MQMRQAFYRLVNMQGVAHTTLNPYGPGVVRIHLVPPKFNFRGITPSVVILNGHDIIPINSSWAILLNIFIEEVNHYDGKEITDSEMENIVKKTISKAQSIFPKTSPRKMKRDLWKIVETLCDVAYGKEPKTDIGYMTLGEYAPNMKAPHRMDLMVSSMCRNGQWNCNQKCINCYAAGQAQASVNELSTADWKKVIDKCKHIGIPQLTFTGGEPTLRRDLVELVEHAKWFVTRLNTNGINLTKSLCEELYDASLDSVQVTLYSCHEDIHNLLVGADKFKYTVQGIQNALEAGLNVSINTPLCSQNADYTSTLMFLKELGIEYVSCSGMIMAGNALSEKSKASHLTSFELTHTLRSAVHFCEKEHMQIDFTSPGWLPEETLRELGLNVPTCGACLSNMAIAPNGNVVPCQSWLSQNASLGNILDTPWNKIWDSARCSNIRNFSSSSTGTCPLKNKEVLK